MSDETAHLTAVVAKALLDVDPCLTSGPIDKLSLAVVDALIADGALIVTCDADPFPDHDDGDRGHCRISREDAE